MAYFKTLDDAKKSIGKGGEASKPFSEKRIVGKDPVKVITEKDPEKQATYKGKNGKMVKLRKGHHQGSQA